MREGLDYNSIYFDSTKHGLMQKMKEYTKEIKEEKILFKRGIDIQ